MNLYLARGDCLRFPASARDIQEGITRLNADGIRIVAAKSPVHNLAKYIQRADLGSMDDLRALNSIAERTDAMTEAEANIFSGALDAESVNGLGDVLRIAQSLEQYEIIPEVTTDRELGGWLVENDLLGVSFPDAVRPYLDYVAIGAEYYANHGGAYTLNGYVKRKEAAPELGMDNACIRLTLAGEHSTFPVCLPDWGGKLELAKRVLNLDNLDGAVVRKIEFKPSMSELERLLPLDCITAGDANDLACILGQIEQSGELKKYYCALSAIPASRLIDLAYSTDRCHVLPEVKDDAALGRFYAENGFVMEAEEIPDRLFEMLDFGKIGREMRQSDGGVYTHGGYVMRHSELAEVYKDMDLSPKEPSYTVLLELSSQCGSSTVLPLPAEATAIDAALDAIEALDWREAELCCLDCKVPLLTGVISGYDGTLTELNDFAQKLADMDSTSLTAYKALLEATQCDSLDDAKLLADTLDQYIFSAKIASPEELARSELTLMLSPEGAERLIPHVNLYNYGQELLEHFGAVLTDYGMIERRDGQPVQSMTEQQPQQGGMEMM